MYVEKSRKSLYYTLYTLKRGKKIYIHSKYDPVKEARRKVMDIPFFDIYIVLGLGLGYHISALREKYYSSRIIVFEASYEIYKAYKKYGIYMDNVEIYTDKNEFLNFIFTLGTMNVFVFRHLALYTLYKTIYSEVEERVSSVIQREEINKNTMSRFGKAFVRNFVYNLAYIKKYKSLADFRDYFHKNTCIIVSAGPSLEENIGFLKKYRNKVVIFSVDTAYGFLVKYEIYPDFVVSVDPQFLNAFYILPYKSNNRSYLISDLLANYLVNRSFKDKVILMTPPILDKFGIFNSLFPAVKYGGSVLTSAISSALYMGFSNILFVGLDLAFREYKTHIRNTPIYDKLLFSNNRLFSLEGEIYKRIKAIPSFIFHNSDEKMISNRKFMIFKNWIEKVIESNAGINFYRIGGGIFIRGIIDIKIKEVKSLISFGDEKKISINDFLENKELIFFLKRMRDSIKFLKEEIYKALIYIACNRRGKGYKEKILKKMFLIEQKILDFKDIVNIAGLGVQREAVLIRGSDGRGSVSLYRLYSFYNRLYKAFMYMEEKIRKVVESI